MPKTAQEMIAALGNLPEKTRVSKYLIAQTLEVSWNAVHAWHRGIYEPKDPKHVELLRRLCKERGIKP